MYVLFYLPIKKNHNFNKLLLIKYYINLVWLNKLILCKTGIITEVSLNLSLENTSLNCHFHN